MTFVGDPLATPRRTPGWPVSNGCVTAVKTLFTPISHKYSTDLRIYGFTPLPPPLLGHPVDAEQRIKLPPATSRRLFAALHAALALRVQSSGNLRLPSVTQHTFLSSGSVGRSFEYSTAEHFNARVS